MKKLIALLMVFVLCFGLVACGNADVTEEPENSAGETTEEEIVIAWEEVNGERVIPESEFAKCLEVVTLTEENWQDYFKVMTVTQEIYGDGEVASGAYNKCLLGVVGKYYYLVDFQMSLKVKSTGYVYNYETRPTFFGRVTDDDLECLSVSGTLILLDIPTEVVSIHPETNAGVFYVGTENTQLFHIIDGVYIYGDDLGEFWK